MPKIGFDELTRVLDWKIEQPSPEDLELPELSPGEMLILGLTIRQTTALERIADALERAHPANIGNPTGD